MDAEEKTESAHSHMTLWEHLSTAHQICLMLQNCSLTSSMSSGYYCRQIATTCRVDAAVDTSQWHQKGRKHWAHLCYYSMMSLEELEQPINMQLRDKQVVSLPRCSSFTDIKSSLAISTLRQYLQVEIHSTWHYGCKNTQLILKLCIWIRHLFAKDTNSRQSC